MDIQETQGHVEASTSNLVKILFACTLALVVLGAAAVVLQKLKPAGFGSSTDDTPSATVVAELVRGGDDEAALEAYELIVNSDTNPIRQAHAVRNVSGIKYKMSGDIEDALESVRELKNSIEDSTLPLDLRMKLFNTMVNMYSQTGDHPAVFEEIFSTEPYSRFEEPGNPIRSIRQLFEWGFENYPTARAAVNIAALSVREALNAPDMSDEEIAQYTQGAKLYLQEAEVLTQEEIEETVARGRDYRDTRTYAGQRFWEAFTVGGLGLLGDPESARTYHGVYQDVFNFLEGHAHTEVRQYIPFTHWTYAIFLDAHGEREDARAHLREVIAFIENDPNFDTNEFVWNAQNRLIDNREVNDFLYDRIFFGQSDPEFSEFFDRIEPREEVSE